jgi:uncharacterized small protein (DUF1192 family)
LIAAGGIEGAMRAGAEHIAVGEKPMIQRGPDLIDLTFLDQPGGVEPAIKMLRQRMVLRSGSSSEMIERQAEAPVDVGLDRVLFVAERTHILSGRDGAEFGGRAVFIGGADEQHVIAELPPEAGMDIGRQQRACEIAEMFDAVHVRQRTGNENFGHGSDLSRKGDAESDRHQKALPRDRKGLDSAYRPGAKTRALSPPVEPHTVGPGHSIGEWRACKNHFGLLTNLRRIARHGKNTSRGTQGLEKRMATEDDDKPRKKITHEIGQDLSLLSVEELAERIALMQQEIERLQAAMTKKRASKGCGQQFFQVVSVGAAMRSSLSGACGGGCRAKRGGWGLSPRVVSRREPPPQPSPASAGEGAHCATARALSLGQWPTWQTNPEENRSFTIN